MTSGTDSVCADGDGDALADERAEAGQLGTQLVLARRNPREHEAPAGVRRLRAHEAGRRVAQRQLHRRQRAAGRVRDRSSDRGRGLAGRRRRAEEDETERKQCFQHGCATLYRLSEHGWRGGP